MNYRRICILALSMLMVLSFDLGAQQTASGGRQLAPTPPMGWANWNTFGCKCDDATIRATADRLVSSGMAARGYRYIIIQECIASRRDAHGVLAPDPKKFPAGIPALVNYIHQRGLKAGIYTDVGDQTCANYVGSWQHERQDAATFAAWGLDLIEEDFCHKPAQITAAQLYQRMNQAILATHRPMILYICNWGKEDPWRWGRSAGQLWRTGPDITMNLGHADWKDIVRNFDINSRHPEAAGPGGWNDPDMLLVGVPGISLTEAQAHFSLWAMSAAPLWAGNDLMHMSPEVQRILTNREVIAIDQDPRGRQARPVGVHADGLQVWARPLEGRHSWAVALFNRRREPATITVDWRDLNPGMQSACVRDLWRHVDRLVPQQHFAAMVPAHGVVLLRVRPAGQCR